MKYLILLIALTFTFNDIHAAENAFKLQKDDVILNYTTRITMNQKDGVKKVTIRDKKVLVPKGEENDPQTIARVEKAIKHSLKRPKSGTMVAVAAVAAVGKTVGDVIGYVESAKNIVRGVTDLGKAIGPALTNLTPHVMNLTNNVLIPKLVSGELFTDVNTIGQGLAVGVGTAIGSSVRHTGTTIQKVGQMGIDHLQQQAFQSMQAPTGTYTPPFSVNFPQSPFPQGVFQ